MSVCVYVCVCAPRHSHLVVAAALAPPRPALSLTRPLPVLAHLLSVLLSKVLKCQVDKDFNRFMGQYKSIFSNKLKNKI